MKTWPPGTPDVVTPIRRHHSPFCESTGPVVREGFVATRVRALQDLQAHARAGNRSHSPMIPCPPRWSRPCIPSNPAEPYHAHILPAASNTTSESKKPAGQSKGSLLQKTKDGNYVTNVEEGSPSVAFQTEGSKQKSTISMLDESYEASNQHVHYGDIAVEIASSDEHAQVDALYELPVHSTPHATLFMQTAGSGQGSELSADCTPPCTGTEDVHPDAMRSTNLEGQQPSEDEIFGPRPISASLADSSTLSDCFPPGNFEEDKGGFDDKNSGSQRSSRRSVAEKLGSLVEGGWVAGDLFDKVVHDSHGHKSMAPDQGSQDDRADNAPSFAVKDEQASKSQSYENIDESTNATENQNHAHSTSHGVPHESGCSPTPPSQQRKKPTEKHTRHDPTKSLLQRSSSDGGSYMTQSTTHAKVTNRRAWSANHSARLRRSQSESIELDNLNQLETAKSPNGRSRSISRLGTSQKAVDNGSSNEKSASECDRDRRLSSHASFRENSDQSSMNEVKSNDKSSRSTSWFGKSWLSPFSGEKEGVDREPPIRSLIHASASGTTDGVPQGLASRSEQLSRTGDSATTTDKTHEEAGAKAGLSMSSSATQDVIGKKGGTTRSARQDLSPHSQQLSRSSSKAQIMTGANNEAELSMSPATTTDDMIAHARASKASAIADTANAPKEQDLDRGGQVIEERFSASFSSSAGSQVVAGSSGHAAPQHTDRSSEGSQRSTKVGPTMVPARQSSKRARTRSSKGPSSASVDSTCSLSSQPETTSVAFRQSESRSHKPSVPVSIRSSRQSSRPSLLPHVKSAGSSPKSQVGPPNGQRPEGHAGGELGERRGIRRIQVTITFDGSDDEMIETATLQGRRWRFHREFELDVD